MVLWLLLTALRFTHAAFVSLPDELGPQGHNVSDAHVDPEVPLSMPCSEATCQSLSLVTPSIFSHLGKRPSNTLIGSLGKMEDFCWLLKTAQAFQPWLMHNHFLYSSCFYSTILPTFSHKQMTTPNTLPRPIWLEERMSMFFTSGRAGKAGAASARDESVILEPQCTSTFTWVIWFS